MVQAVLIRSKLVSGFFWPGEERSDSVQVEPEQERIVRGDLESFGDTIPDSKYLDCKETISCTPLFEVNIMPILFFYTSRYEFTYE